MNGREPLLPTVPRAAAVPPPEEARLRFAVAPSAPPDVVVPFCVFTAPATPLVCEPEVALCVDAAVDVDAVVPAAGDVGEVAVPVTLVLVPELVLAAAAPLAVLVVPVVSPVPDCVEPDDDSFSWSLNEVEPVDSFSLLWHDVEPLVDSCSPDFDPVEPDLPAPAPDLAEPVVVCFFR